MTGASRGIGAATAIKLALLGSDLALNFRSKSRRAEEVAREIFAIGRRGITVQADLTIQAELEAMMAMIEGEFQRLDVLVLNASGGLEKGKTEDYAMALNHTAQLQTAKLATPLIAGGGRIVFVTSHWAHFYGQKPVDDEYEVVASSKYFGRASIARVRLRAERKQHFTCGREWRRH